MPLNSNLDLNHPEFDRALAQKLYSDGFAEIRSELFSAQRLQAVYGVWNEFFRSKIKFHWKNRDDALDGYFPFESEIAIGATQKDPKEFYHYYLWGKHPSEVYNLTNSVFIDLKILALRVLTALEQFGHPRQFHQLMRSIPEVVDVSDRLLMRISHYQVSSMQNFESAPLNAIHNDIDLITLLPAATAGGLEVQSRSGLWHQISPDPTVILVFCGDLLEYCSGGYYKAVPHQVINLIGNKSRMSLSFFVNPPDDLQMSEEKTARDLLIERLNQIGLKGGLLPVS